MRLNRVPVFRDVSSTGVTGTLTLGDVGGTLLPLLFVTQQYRGAPYKPVPS
jgi:hypothetical protein